MKLFDRVAKPIPESCVADAVQTSVASKDGKGPKMRVWCRLKNVSSVLEYVSAGAMPSSSSVETGASRYPWFSTIDRSVAYVDAELRGSVRPQPAASNACINDSRDPRKSRLVRSDGTFVFSVAVRNGSDFTSGCSDCSICGDGAGATGPNVVVND